MIDLQSIKTQSSFQDRLMDLGFEPKREQVMTLQINLGKLCNQACRHCHVEAGPTKRRENMDSKTVERIKMLIRESPQLETVDMTGGAPELNPHFKDLVQFASGQGLEVIDRCNLTVLFEPGQEETAEFLAKLKVHVVASLPCYSRENVDRQRGNGVFDKSIRALKRLNSLGYGKGSLQLSLVYNPLGTFLPPDQMQLETKYKKELKEDFDIEFDNLFTITNMPIKRFLEDLRRSGKLNEYLELLRNSFNPQALENIMCRSLVSVSWDGRIYDCDFNQMLDIPHLVTNMKTIWDIQSFSDLNDSSIAVDDHCYGCTAGCGSSCTGSLTGKENG